MENLIKFAFEHQLIFFYLSLVLGLILIFTLLIINKIFKMFHILMEKNNDTQILLEFIIRKLMQITPMTVNDIYKLRDSLSEASIVIKNFITKKIESDSYKKIKRKMDFNEVNSDVEENEGNLTDEEILTRRERISKKNLEYERKVDGRRNNSTFVVDEKERDRRELEMEIIERLNNYNFTQLSDLFKYLEINKKMRTNEKGNNDE